MGGKKWGDLVPLVLLKALLQSFRSTDQIITIVITGGYELLSPGQKPKGNA